MCDVVNLLFKENKTHAKGKKLAKELRIEENPLEGCRHWHWQQKKQDMLLILKIK